MYRSLEIRNFRCFGHLKLDKLARINLIAGRNNVGKTALLEAVFLHCAGFNPEKVLTVAGMRGLTRFKLETGGKFIASPWNTIFHDFNEEKAIEILGHEVGRAARSVRISVVRDRARLARIPGTCLASRRRRERDHGVRVVWGGTGVAIVGWAETS